MAAPTIFRSTDGGAPSLTGTVGALIGILDACLVTGLSWTKDYSGTNRAVYRAPSGIRDYLDVNDNGPDATQLAKNATLVGYETMTAVGAGTRPFPDTSQTAVGAGFRKSNTADATVRPWYLIGDDRSFYLAADPSVSGAGGTFGAGAGMMTFGEIYSHLSADLNRTILNTAMLGSDATANIGPLRVCGLSPTTGSTVVNAWMKRSYTALGIAVWVHGQENSISGSAFSQAVGGNLPGPDAIDGGWRLNKILIWERGNGTTALAGLRALRGRYRGLWQFNHNTGFADGDTISGTGALAGKTFLIRAHSQAQFAFETTAWESN